MATPDKGSDCYYTCACTPSALADVLSTIRRKQGGVFPVRVRLGFLDANGRRMCQSGVITGVLDNGDEVYIDAETYEYTEATKKYKEEQNGKSHA